MSQNPTERARYSHRNFQEKVPQASTGLKTLLNGLGILTRIILEKLPCQVLGLKTLLNGLGILTEYIQRQYRFEWRYVSKPY